MEIPETFRSHPPRMLVLLPCFNEEGRIGAVVRDVRRGFPAADVLVVDDASDDRSPGEAAEAGARVLRHGCNLGYGVALETGYFFAQLHGYDVLVQMDSDGQHRPDQIPILLSALDGESCDLVIGSRYGTGGAGPAWIRRVGHRIFAGLVLLLTRMRLTDPTSGFQALNARALRLFAGGFFPCDYPDSDVILMAYMAGLRIREVPVRMKPRAGGTSMHSGLRPLYYALKMILAMFIVLLNFQLWKNWRADTPN